MGYYYDTKDCYSEEEMIERSEFWNDVCDYRDRWFAYEAPRKSRENEDMTFDHLEYNYI